MLLLGLCTLPNRFLILIALVDSDFSAAFQALVQGEVPDWKPRHTLYAVLEWKVKEMPESKDLEIQKWGFVF